MEFQQGEVVQLNSGGPEMTVKGIISAAVGVLHQQQLNMLVWLVKNTNQGETMKQCWIRKVCTLELPRKSAAEDLLVKEKPGSVNRALCVLTLPYLFLSTRFPLC